MYIHFYIYIYITFCLSHIATWQSFSIPPAPPWATAAAMGPGGGGGEAPEDDTKPRQAIQSPDRLYKAPTDSTKPQ